MSLNFSIYFLEFLWEIVFGVMSGKIYQLEASAFPCPGYPRALDCPPCPRVFEFCMGRMGICTFHWWGGEFESQSLTSFQRIHVVVQGMERFKGKKSLSLGNG